MTKVDERSIQDIEFDEIKDLLDDTYYLVYVDYRDSFDGREEEIQQAIHKQCWSPLDEAIGDWFIESQWHGEDYAIDELKKRIKSEFDLDDEDAEYLVHDKFHDHLRETILDRDKSTPISDLIRNTGPIVAFYDTGYDVDADSWAWGEEHFREEVDGVKNALRILHQVDGHSYDYDIREMLANASYGGRLVVYFHLDIEEWINIGNHNTITFDNPAIAVIDTFNGSGWHTHLNRHEFSLPLDVENVFFDKTIKYNFTYSVCGMDSNWCDSTGVELSTTDSQDEISRSSLNAELGVESMYQKAYDEGGCTHGDMDYKRHRNQKYINEFPCGTHCMDCGTFWID